MILIAELFNGHSCDLALPTISPFRNQNVTDSLAEIS